MIYFVGNAHVDPAWMWRVGEGLEAFLATCRSALERIEETPGFIFTASSAAHYAFVEQTDPSLFAAIQAAVAKGRWSLVGGWWVEADCNIPCGESLIRQALLGQSYFRSRFGRIASIGYNIDSFGHNPNLPRLLRGAGLRSYVFMRPEEHEKHLEDPYFVWAAPGGESVAAYRIPFHYSNHQQDSREKLEGLISSAYYDPNADWMLFFGVGNHGGGPTKEEIARIEELKRRHRDLRFGDTEAFFANAKPELPAIELDLQEHAIGCYSAHSEIKQLNRRAEAALLLAERMTVMAQLSGLPVQAINVQAWKNVCFAQFHDLLGGVAIREACDEAISMQREAISIAERSTRLNIQRLARAIDTSSSIENLIVFNPSTFDREELVEFELWHPHASERGEPIEGLRLSDSSGLSILTQKVESSGKIGKDRVAFLARVACPAFGAAQFGIERLRSVEARSSSLLVTERSLSNEFVAISFDGNVGSSLGKLSEADLSYTSARVFKDSSDTWAHGVLAFEDVEGDFTVTDITVIEGGPLRASVRVSSTYGDSRMQEEFSLEAGGRTIAVRVWLDWREKRKVLKLKYPHRVEDAVATYEVPYASVARPLGPNERPGQRWVDVSNGHKGVAVITDCKSSFSIDHEHVQVTVARSPLFAHHVPPHDSMPEAVERLRYLDQGEQEFRVWIVPHHGDFRSADIPRLVERLTFPFIQHLESSHDGTTPTQNSLKVSGDGVQLGALKLSEDGRAIVLRVAEQFGKPSVAKIEIGGVAWRGELSAFEIKTLRLDNNGIAPVSFLEE